MFGPASGGVPDVRLTFEAIVEVGMATAEPLHEARRQVEREEEDTPALVLFHVDVLVETSSPQRVVIDTDDDMTERDCGEAKWHRQQADEALDRSASHFQGAVDEMKRGAGSQCEKGKRDPHDCGGERPDISGHRPHQAHGWWKLTCRALPRDLDRSARPEVTRYCRCASVCVPPGLQVLGRR